MKKILFAMAAAAMVLGAASCQKADFGKVNGSKVVDNPLEVIKVVNGADSRLAIDSETLAPAFEANDVIFGWDKDGNTYSYSCSSVEDGVATFVRTSEYAPSADEGTVVNLVYAPGYADKDIADKALEVSLASQKELPVVMSATGAVDASGNCVVTFANNVAVINVKDAVIPGAASADEFKISFTGKYSALQFTLDEDGKIAVAPAVEGVIEKSDKVAASAESKISAQIAVPATGEAVTAVISALGPDGAVYNCTAEKEIVAGKYINVAGNEFVPEYVAEIGGTQYKTIESAVEAANEAPSDVTIKLLKDVAKAGVLHSLTVNNASAKVTIDFNDFVINSGMNPSLICSTSVVLVDNGPLKKGGITSTSMAIAVRGGDNEFNGGNFFGHNTYGVLRTYKDSKTTINEGVTMTTDDKSRVINVGYNSSNKGGDVIINGGTFTSTNWGTIRCTYGKLVVNGGTFVSGCDSVLYASSSATEVSGATVNGGYFYAAEAAPSDHPEAYVGGPGLGGSVRGGYFNYKPADDAKASGFNYVECTKTVEGRTYNWTLEESTVAVADVDGTQYSSFDAAFAAVTSATSPSVIKLLANVSSGARNWTNKNSVDITFDLNGYVFSSSADSLIFTSTNLIITDHSEGAAGKVTSSGTGVISLGGLAPGNVTIDGCTIECTDTDASGSALRIRGSNGKERVANTQSITVKNGAKIISTSRLCYCAYGNMAFYDCELTCGTSNASTSIYNMTGGEIDIYDGCSLVNKSGNAVITSATSNSTQKSYLRIHGGWFQGKDDSTIMTASSSNSNNYLKNISIDGGHFSTNVMTNKSDYAPTYENGKKLVESESKHTHGGVEYTYGYEVK